MHHKASSWSCAVTNGNASVTRNPLLQVWRLFEVRLEDHHGVCGALLQAEPVAIGCAVSSGVALVTRSSCYRYGDSLKSGWKTVMECVMRLYKLNLLPEAVLLLEAEDPEAAKQRLPRPDNKARNSSAGSYLHRAISRYMQSQLNLPLVSWPCNLCPMGCLRLR